MTLPPYQLYPRGPSPPWAMQPGPRLNHAHSRLESPQPPSPLHLPPSALPVPSRGPSLSTLSVCIPSPPPNSRATILPSPEPPSPLHLIDKRLAILCCKTQWASSPPCHSATMARLPPSSHIFVGPLPSPTARPPLPPLPLHALSLTPPLAQSIPHLTHFLYPLTPIHPSDNKPRERR